MSWTSRSWRHPSVKRAHAGSIYLLSPHGCLLSSQSSLAPSLPMFPFLFMQEHKAVGLSSQGSSRLLLRRPQVLFFPCPNEPGNEKAFLESVKENPFILSSGNNWETIVIRERSDFQGTQWPASSSTTPTTQRQTPRVCGGSRVLIPPPQLHWLSLYWALLGKEPGAGWVFDPNTLTFSPSAPKNFRSRVASAICS